MNQIDKPSSGKGLLGFLPRFHKEDLRAGLKNPLVFLAQGLGSGCIRPMPGSWGTLAGLLVFLLLDGFLPLSYMLIFVAAASIGGIPLCTYAEKKLGQADPHSIVWDEWCGIWLALVLAPRVVIIYIIAFFLFRWFDIKKPWLIGWADEKLKHGAGIMLDDILAGIASFLVLAVLTIIFGVFGAP